MIFHTRRPGFLQHQLSGFLLLEASLALLILGCVSAALIPMVRTARAYHIALQSRRISTQICRSLAVYVQRNNRLPWACASQNGEETEGVSAGHLPNRTLGLPDSITRLGSGSASWRVCYVVNPDLTAWRAVNVLDKGSAWEAIPPTDALQIFDCNNQPVIADNESDCCALAICLFPKNSSLALADIVQSTAGALSLRIPHPQSGVRVHWVSHNNLSALYAD